MTRAALAILCLLLAAPARAQDGSGSNFGGVGLVEMRNARFRPDGMIEAGTALRHQRGFFFLGSRR